MAERSIVGWDIGGAHVKACLMQAGLVRDVAQWPCPLWQGTEHLEHAIALAVARWPEAAPAQHAVTRTGAMVDLFQDREDGVLRIAALLAGALPAPHFYAGRAGWCAAADVAPHWQAIASANWLASARHVASRLPDATGMLVDIGSTTTDFIAFARGAVPSASRGDAERLASGELVYHGVVRTPLCALAQRIAWRGQALNVMNEFFATSADVYRLTGELPAAHDQHPAADSGAKDIAATQARLARMIGLDARDGTADEWWALAGAWRTQQVAYLRGQLERAIAAHALPADAIIVSAGCGDFLVPELAPPGWRCLHYGRDIARIAPDAAAGTQEWAQVAAPSVAVAALFELEPA